MDWTSVQFDWNQTRAFLVTAEEGSLSAAARALGLAQPTLGRQVDALERELDVVLFERAGRGLKLTPSGLELLEHARAMGEAALRMSLTAVGQSQSLDGKITIAASEVYAAMLLPSIVAKLRSLHPGIDIEIVASHSPSDLRRHEADIAIRNFRPTQPDLVAKKICDVPARLYATPSYLETIGCPKSPADLSGEAQFIDIDRDGRFMNALNATGLDLDPSQFSIFTEDMLVMWAFVKQGLGIGVLDARLGDAEPLVRRVLPDFAPMMFPIWLVAHREVSTSRRLRLVFDLLTQELSSD